MADEVHSPQAPGGAKQGGFKGGADLEPSVDLSDDELLKLSAQWEEESNSFHDELKKVQDLNERYYFGDQTKKESIPSHKCDAVENKIFMGVETVVPMVTANTPQFVALPAQENEKSDKLASSLQEILKARYESFNVDVRSKLRVAVRHMIIYRFGVLKMFWDESIDDANVKFVRPQRIWIPKYGKSVDELPFVMEKVDMDFDEIEDVFGEDILEKVKQSAGSDKDEPDLSRVVTVLECWTNDFVFWRYGSLILKKMKNPYFDFTGRTEETTDEDGNAVVEDLFYNHFRKPRKPFIFLSAFRLGDSIIGATDLIQQSIPIQDIINTLNRQVVNNAKKMGNAAWYVDSSVMPEEDARNKITNEEGLIVYGEDAANQNMVRRDSPPPLPNYIPNAKLQAENAFDNIFGTHATTRGERRQPETLGGRMLLKQADISRTGTFVEEIDRGVADLGNWFTQLIKLYYEKEKTIKIYGDDGVQFINFSRDNIEDGIEVVVKAGSTIQVDEVSRRNEALILWQNRAIDPLTLFERLKLPNPREAANRLAQWKMGKLVPSQEGIPPDMAIKGSATPVATQGGGAQFGATPGGG